MSDDAFEIPRIFHLIDKFINSFSTNCDFDLRRIGVVFQRIFREAFTDTKKNLFASLQT